MSLLSDFKYVIAPSISSIKSGIHFKCILILLLALIVFSALLITSISVPLVLIEIKSKFVSKLSTVITSTVLLLS
jgi:hypothetical protein